MCIAPIRVKNSGDIPVPCSRCPECKSRRVSGWSMRLRDEWKHSSSSLFLTLTYDTLNVPITRNGFMGLDPRDLQLFFKRLRIAHGRDVISPIKYFAAGEYGSDSDRPHYHIILFNSKIELIQNAWAKLDKKTGELTYLGFVHYGKVSEASIGYTLKYISKPSRIPLHRNDDRVPEFSRMSQGLGKGYLTPQMIAWHKADIVNRCYINLKDGKKISMPRYLKNRLYTDEEREKIAAEALQKHFGRLEDITTGTFGTIEAYNEGQKAVRETIWNYSKLRRRDKL